MEQYAGRRIERESVKDDGGELTAGDGTEEQCHRREKTPTADGGVSMNRIISVRNTYVTPQGSAPVPQEQTHMTHNNSIHIYTHHGQAWSRRRGAHTVADARRRKDSLRVRAVGIG